MRFNSFYELKMFCLGLERLNFSTSTDFNELRRYFKGQRHIAHFKCTIEFSNDGKKVEINFTKKDIYFLSIVYTR